MLQELNENVSPITWAGISNGLIVIRADENTPGAKSRTNKLGNVVYEKFYKSISGFITALSIEDNKFGEKEIKLELTNEEKKGVLTIKANTSYGRYFFNQIFNVDFSKMVDFSPWQKITPEGDKKTALYLNYANRVKVKWGLPQGCPELVFHDVKGKKVLDNISKINQEDFLEIELNKLIIANNLTYTKTTVDKPSIESDEAKLTTEELKTLKALKKENKSKTTSTEEDEFDFFN